MNGAVPNFSMKKAHKYSSYFLRVITAMGLLFLLLPLPFFIPKITFLQGAYFECLVLLIGYLRTRKFARFFIEEIIISNEKIIICFYDYNRPRREELNMEAIKLSISRDISPKSSKSALKVKFGDVEIIQPEYYGWTRSDFLELAKYFPSSNVKIEH